MLLDAISRKRQGNASVQNATTLQSAGLSGVNIQNGETNATKLAVVNRCLEVISDSIGKMPSYAINSATRERQNPKVLELLNVRPNEAMTPFIRRKMLELNRLMKGSAYDWIIRDPISMEPVELIPLPAALVDHWQDTAGKVWFDVIHPYNGDRMRLPAEDVIPYKAFSTDGIHSVSVLQRASEVLTSAHAAQEYHNQFYQSGGQPSGILTVDTDLGGPVLGPDKRPTGITKRDAIRKEWNNSHAGPHKAWAVAILDNGMKYTPISASMKDAQWVESHDVTVIDICNFFGVPAYKVNAGKQSYRSNEQNAIEYVTGTLHPIVTQYEQAQTWGLLMPSQRRTGMELHINMMVELRGDNASRATWYKNMREIGAYSVNDIRMHEMLPDVPGGDSRYANWNFGPLGGT